MSPKRIGFRAEADIERFIAYAAQLEGVPISEFIRTASISRAAFTVGRHKPGVVAHWRTLYENIGEAIEDLIGEDGFDR